MNQIETKMTSREAAIGGLAVVGFISIVGASMWLAVYATRFVPGVVNRIGEATVYLGSIFTPEPDPILSVIPTIIPFDEASSTPITTASTTIASISSASSSLPKIIPTKTSATTTSPKTQPKRATPIIGPKANSTQVIGVATTTVTTASLSGLPDLIVQIQEVGYLTTASTDAFVASSTVPYGNRPAVKFTIKNIGTNASGSWRFSASIPTQNAYIYQSYQQQPLSPGDGIDYTLGFDQANRGTGQVISITANFDQAIAESSMANNSTSTRITILGL